MWDLSTKKEETLIWLVLTQPSKKGVFSWIVYHKTSATCHILWIPAITLSKTYRNGTSVAFICRRYKISKASLMRWNKRFDGSKESLCDKSHRPLTPHPNSHTNEEINWIKHCIRRNPKATLIEIFYKLKTNKGYHRHPCSLFRILRKLGFFKASKEKKKAYKPKPYHTPNEIGVKWQMDVKYAAKIGRASCRERV